MYSIRRAKERLDGFGHPLLDGLELLYINACYESMPAPAAERWLVMLNQVVVAQESLWPIDDVARAALCVLNLLLWLYIV